MIDHEQGTATARGWFWRINPNWYGISITCWDVDVLFFNACSVWRLCRSELLLHLRQQLSELWNARIENRNSWELLQYLRTMSTIYKLIADSVWADLVKLRVDLGKIEPLLVRHRVRIWRTQSECMKQ